ncbi:MAG: response regulator transcription factor [Chloroflexi bacterium]|nr:MAG: response regulator transcription factor [Chloroflexota bacterium]
MGSGGRILVVDDDPIVGDVLSRYLIREGYNTEVAADAEQALEACERSLPDLVVLDLMLPRIDGVEAFRRIQARGPVPVIMLTAKGEETDRVVGLELGADDYIVKPFSPREVVARVRAVLRRAADGERHRTRTETLDFDNLHIDGRRREARLGSRVLRLTPKEFDLLYFLARNPGKVFTRVRLIEELWDFAYDGDPSTVTVHLRRLREKIEADPARPRWLVTVWGAGYRFEP